jgi:hypothetical protein
VLEDQQEEEYRFKIINDALDSSYNDGYINGEEHHKAKLFVSVFNDLYTEIFALRKELRELKEQNHENSKELPEV